MAKTLIEQAEHYREQVRRQNEASKRIGIPFLAACLRE